MGNTDACSPDEWAILMQHAADDANAERAYQEMKDDANRYAEMAAADAEADAASHALDKADARETDLW